MRRTALRVFYDGAGLLIFAVMIFPIYWMVTTALKPGKEILSLDPYWFPAPAMVDGASRVGAFMRIVFPLVAPGLVATAIFGFIQAWNEYIIAYVLLSSSSKQTLTIWLASFTTQHGTDWGGLMAGATLTSLPVVVFFLLVQRQITGGLTAGAVKG